MSEPIKLDAADVIIRSIGRPICLECGRQSELHNVIVDFRNAGMASEVAVNLCRFCAEDAAKRIRQSLPPRAQKAKKP
jgi:hypothetical protein